MIGFAVQQEGGVFGKGKEAIEFHRSLEGAVAALCKTEAKSILGSFGASCR